MVLQHALQAFLIAGVVSPFSYYAGMYVGVVGGWCAHVTAFPLTSCLAQMRP